MKRRSLLALLATSPSFASAAESSLPVPDSLPRIASEAARYFEPLVLLISLPGCPYCELVRRNYLAPARRDAHLQAWQLTITDRVTPLVGFDGKTTTAAAQVAVWRTSFTPTVLFLNAGGRDLAERLIGMGSVDFYGAYLEARLLTARNALGRPS